MRWSRRQALAAVSGVSLLAATGCLEYTPDTRPDLPEQDITMSARLAESMSLQIDSTEFVGDSNTGFLVSGRIQPRHAGNHHAGRRTTADTQTHLTVTLSGESLAQTETDTLSIDAESETEFTIVLEDAPAIQTYTLDITLTPGELYPTFVDRIPRRDPVNGGEVVGVGELVTPPTSQLIAGEPTTVKITVESRTPTIDETPVFGALGSLAGQVYGLQRIDRTGSDSSFLTTELPADAALTTLAWTWLPAPTRPRAVDKYTQFAAGGRLYPDGWNASVALGVVAK